MTGRDHEAFVEAWARQGGDMSEAEYQQHKEKQINKILLAVRREKRLRRVREVAAWTPWLGVVGGAVGWGMTSGWPQVVVAVVTGGCSVGVLYQMIRLLCRKVRARLTAGQGRGGVLETLKTEETPCLVYPALLVCDEKRRKLTIFRRFGPLQWFWDTTKEGPS